MFLLSDRNTRSKSNSWKIDHHIVFWNLCKVKKDDEAKLPPTQHESFSYFKTPKNLTAQFSCFIFPYKTMDVSFSDKTTFSLIRLFQTFCEKLIPKCGIFFPTRGGSVKAHLGASWYSCYCNVHVTAVILVIVKFLADSKYLSFVRLW